MSESRSALLARKEDLFSALRTLEQDHVDGVVDAQAYGETRRRYEIEAAQVLERLDSLHQREDRRFDWSRRRWTLLAASATTLLVVALLILIVSSLHHPSPSAPVAVTTANGPSPAALADVRSAKAQVLRHPGSVDDLLTLAAAELQANNSAAADAAYLRAMRLAPNRPEAPTLHALVLSAQNKNGTALALLTQVERRNPTYARAWLTDGLIASRRPPGIPRAVRAWTHFLHLQPIGPVATEIRPLLTALKHTLATAPHR